ncbi:hypothetical protein [Texcoconibacillus texcoconensis]|uniref:Endolytic transglycosylase MltG n=1 Tax=Texcoconibacillus texcoconensis TaxID=1095777 RepID=A0A840QP10_9BACI|nr:hypothetical protein [Texcoconibacillus texcoconensis]MBB5173136.1 hypothetical protein [Texcoconibacillus texcoconensis]
MSKSDMRGVAAGLFLATAVFASLTLFTDEAEQNEAKTTDQLTWEELASFAEDEGASVIKQEDMEEIEKEVASLRQKRDSLATQLEEINDEVEEEKNIEYRLVLNIHDGMTSHELAETLADAAMIEDVNEFQSLLQEKDLVRQIRTGQFVLTSNMSAEEMIDVVTH